MSLESDVIGHAVMLLEQTVSWTVNGTADNPRRVRKIDLATEHIKAWMKRILPKDGERGGSSSPRESDDRVEAQRVANQVRRDRDDLAEHLKALNIVARGIYDITVRNVNVIDPSKLPQESAPGCLSCARSGLENGVHVGGHFAPVYEKSKKRGLCRWCADVESATNALPPMRACDIYHRMGPSAAGRWMSRYTAA